MPLQMLSLKLEGITAGDYLTWCRDPEPPALDFALRSISIQAEPLGDTITAILDWSHSSPPGAAAASAAGLSLSMVATIDEMRTNRRHSAPPAPGTRPGLRHAAHGVGADAESRLPRSAGIQRQLPSAA